ncbi:heme o synthase [Hoeflea poritis]|uniref:Protoheme IX farnesyltransferase n=1 Tax=Hoeflea poritis TaxID=2993659 RepID=A0ABT4VJE2_9HYPH|nr:heme o synthase [Hoeflea poritis]MDA4844820.1 heme o synthase [Hoeflea poritis]
MAITGEQGALNGAELGLSQAEPGDYFALLKPRVMSLVVFTAFVGMIIAPGTIHPFLGMVSILCIAVGAGASGALNMWYDADIDAVMSRTASRPVPAGRVGPSEALAFGLVLSAFSILTLGLLVNWLSAALLAFTIFFYVVIYTMWLKRSTPQNIVIGGAAGALPPMIGWACVTGSVSWESFVLFLMIFLWTPPHFWALALFKQGDYHKAGVPMLPNVAGVKSTKRQIFVYAIITALVGVLPYWMGFASAAYGILATGLGLGFVWYAYKVLRMSPADEKMKPAKAMFGFSLIYLFALFATLLVDGLTQGAGA